ncbi:hypothetical protein L3X38_015626 [Prunus dulcis]|uniref:ABC1 atypical kinase-like domain-containing protein n=1 Tax=Prunus dulcis TaxID=3755 RepID=A0AAD4W3U2_PRUDU|nr:hypothetical protein L3X38_015626 [Prunus dulcis]
MRKGKTALCLITATGLTFHAFNPNFLSSSSDSFPNFPEKLRAPIHGFNRSSRAIATIAFTAVDYKFTLHGLSVDSDEYRQKLSEVHRRSASRIRKLCEVNRGFYVKAGQFVAALRQVPKEYSLTLSSLQDQAVPYHFKAIKEVLIRNLGPELSDMFLSLDEHPIAAASIAQVHRGVLKGHQEVAIKVQYPDLEQQMKIDTTTMYFLSKSLAWFFPEYRFEWLVSEFVQSISLELGELLDDIDKLERETKPRLETWTPNPDCGLGTWDLEPEPHVYSLDLEPESWTWNTITCALNLNPINLGSGRLLPETNFENFLSFKFLQKLNSKECSREVEKEVILEIIIEDSEDNNGFRLFNCSTDFIQEARNSETTANNFANNKWVKVPRVFWDLTTHQVLTMEFCTGQKVDDVEYLKERRIHPMKVAEVLLEVFAEMIFIHGFLHGDPHPGNILVSPEGQNGFSLVILDHGIYKKLDEGFRLDYCQLWKALILLDSKNLQRLGERFGVAKYSRYFPVIFTGRTIDSKSALGKAMSVEERRNLKQELKSLKMEDVSSFMESLPSDFLTILRTDGLLRSIVSKLGAPQRVRLLAYGKYALYGLSPKLNPESDFALKVVFSRLKAHASYYRLRLIIEVLQLLSWMAKVKLLLYTMYEKIRLCC